MKLLALGLILAAAAVSSAADFVVSTTGGDWNSMDAYGDPDNWIASFDMDALAPGYTNWRITGVGWNATITAEGNSWLSEASVEWNNSTADSLDAIYASPGFADDNPGTGTYSSGGIIDLTDNGFNDIALNPDNVVRLEFFETFNDVSNVRDGYWHSGWEIQTALTADPVPEPASLSVLALGGLALLRRRRK